MVAVRHEWKAIKQPEQVSSIDRVFGSSKSPVRNELELVERVIAFANGKTNDEPVRRGYAFNVAVRSGWSPRLDPHGEVDEADWNKNVGKFIDTQEVKTLVERDRAAARKVLEAAATDTDKLIEWINAWRATVGSSVGIVRKPTLHFEGRNGLRVTWQLEVEEMSAQSDIRSALAYSAILLVADYQKCRSNLGYCRLPGCGRLFTVERGKPGKPRRDYCSDKHMYEAHAMNATERSRRARAKKKVEAAKRRRRRLS